MPPTAWTSSCAYCGVDFTAPTARTHCTPLCRDRHRWCGVVPDAHRRYAARTARPATTEETP